jgi:hypothetical protein
LVITRTGTGREERTDETIAASRKSFYVSGFFGGIGKSLAKLIDCFVQAVFKINEGLLGPETLLYFLAGNNLSRTFEKH